jgi:NADH-quinone oxidoreductase subunit N
MTAPLTLDLRPVIPAVIVTITAVVVLLAQAFMPPGRPGPSAPLSMLGLGGALASVVLLACYGGRGAVTGSAYVLDDFSLFLHVLILTVGILAVLLSPSYLRATGSDRGEYYALVLFSIVGMLGLVSCIELVSLFVALEVMSVALYGAAGLHRNRPESTESAMKYFISGAFSSAFFLYGVALLYGVSGSTWIDRIAAAVAAARDGGATMAVLGAGLLLVGFGFKVASVPFHMWAPDVYEGAPTSVTVVMAAGVKAAAFGGLLRVFLRALPGLSSEWQPAIAALAFVTMVVGNLGALAQSNLKRMLAYSSVAHAGYLLTALVAAPRVAAEAVLFYLVAYAAVNLGGFGALAALARGGREPLSLGDLAGLARRRPALAAALAVFMISLTGVPISAGFVGKFYLFSAAVNAGYVSLAVVGFLMSVVSAYYYLRVVVAMYMRDPDGEDAWAPVAPAAAVALVVTAVAILGLGVYPGPVLGWARHAAQSLL